MAQAKMSMIKKEAQNKDVEYSHSTNLRMTLFEAASFVAICSFNIYHIKGILDNRRII